MKSNRRSAKNARQNSVSERALRTQGSFPDNSECRDATEHGKEIAARELFADHRYGDQRRYDCQDLDGAIHYDFIIKQHSKNKVSTQRIERKAQAVYKRLSAAEEQRKCNDARNAVPEKCLVDRIGTTRFGRRAANSVSQYSTQSKNDDKTKKQEIQAAQDQCLSQRDQEN